jgi:replicative DNA helicase
MQTDGIVYPHSDELEECLLSSLFDDSENLNEVSTILKSEHFYSEKHRHIYAAFIKILFEGLSPEGPLLVEALKMDGKLEAVGGAIAIVKLKLEVPPAGDVRAYAERIRDLAIKRSMIENAHALIKRAGNGEDVSATINYAYEQLQALTRPKVSFDSRSGVHISNVYTAERMVSEYENYLKNLQDNRFKTGIAEIDRTIRGVGGGEVMTILARAGSFKTAMLQNLLLRYARGSTLSAVFFSIEMPVASVTERYFEILDGCTGHEVERMFLDKSQREIADASIRQFKRDLDNLLIVDTKISLENVPQYLEVIHRELGRKVGLIGIDYLGLMDSVGRDEYQQVSAVAKGLKTMAKAVNLPIIMLSQVNRQGGDGEVEVTLQMGRGSGIIEEAADVVLGLWQQESETSCSSDPQYELICRILKNRKGKKGQRWKLDLDPSTLRFGEHATEYEPPKKTRNRDQEC